jgi:hypothetical protein
MRLYFDSLFELGVVCLHFGQSLLDGCWNKVAEEDSRIVLSDGGAVFKSVLGMAHCLGAAIICFDGYSSIIGRSRVQSE